MSNVIQFGLVAKCHQCGIRFPTEGRRFRYCSPACRKRANEAVAARGGNSLCRHCGGEGCDRCEDVGLELA